MKTTIFSQAIPKLIGGHFFVLAVGKDVTLNGFVQNDPFFSGKSHSGRLVVEMLRTLRSWEYDFGELQPIPYALSPLPVCRFIHMAKTPKTSGSDQVPTRIYADSKTVDHPL